ncbi:MAG TPA: queuosine salvage family protein [Candidatus Woesebacteria bacterium]|nr:queuosine salvage family protein [Candidatus Woesebacteria bacterium]
MTERGEKDEVRLDIREMSEEILSKSQDILSIEKDDISTVLLPKIETYLSEKKASKWLPEGNLLTLEQECGMNLFLNVINFCYKDPSSGHEYVYVTDDGKLIKRATGLITALSRSGIDWDNFAEVQNLSPERWEGVTQISRENPMYLGDERLKRITEFASYLASLGYVNMDDFLGGCDFDTKKMVNIFVNSRYFKDDFLKRAQLACRMINDVWTRRGGFPLKDIETLTVMADYRIPQVFYNLGVVTINDFELMDKLMTGSPIDPNSREERALRATAVVIGKEVAEKLGITEADVDGILWGLSQDMVRKGEMEIPHMIVATDAY